MGRTAVSLRIGTTAIFAVVLFAQLQFAKADEMTKLTKEDAVTAVAMRYANLFENLRIAHPLDGSAVALPVLAAEDFILTGEDGNVWIVRHDPLTGPIITARVGKHSGLVQFDRIDLAVE